MRRSPLTGATTTTATPSKWRSSANLAMGTTHAPMAPANSVCQFPKLDVSVGSNRAESRDTRAHGRIQSRVDRIERIGPRPHPADRKQVTNSLDPGLLGDERGWDGLATLARLLVGRQPGRAADPSGRSASRTGRTGPEQQETCTPASAHAPRSNRSIAHAPLPDRSPPGSWAKCRRRVTYTYPLDPLWVPAAIPTMTDLITTSLEHLRDTHEAARSRYDAFADAA